AIGVDPYFNVIPGPSGARNPESIIADFEYRYEPGNQKTVGMDSGSADYVRVPEQRLFRFRRQLLRLGDPAFDAAGKPDLLADIVGGGRRQFGDLRVVEDAEVVELLLDRR